MNPTFDVTGVQPMLPALTQTPFSNPDWIFEPKWDGYRAICFVDNGMVRFVSKNRKSLTQRFPELQKISISIKAETAIFLCCLHGHSVLNRNSPTDC